MLKFYKWFTMFFAAGTLAYCCMTSVATAATQDNKTSSVSGAKLWANNCSRCHNMRSLDEFRPDQWRVIMAHMRVRAQLTGSEARKILMFLTGQPESVHDSSSTLIITSKNQAEQLSIAKSKQVPTKTERLPKTTKKKDIQSNLFALSGKNIYQKNCAMCHGADGKGAFPGSPDLTQPGGRLSKPQSALLANIEKGIAGMPPKGGNPNLTKDDIKQVLNYMLRTFKNN